MSLFKGSGVALVTPFKNGRIDYHALDALVDWHLQNDTDALIVSGTTGEASTLSSIEKISIAEFVVKKVKKQIPVIAGSGCNNTSEAVYLSKEFQYVGVDGLLVVTPYYNKTTNEGLVKHYMTIANAVPLPIILYSVKSRTGLNIEPSVIEELGKVNNIIGIKEASGDINQVAKICYITKKLKNAGYEFDVYSGNDDQTLPIMSLGGIGCISTVANIIPKDFHNMMKLFDDNNIKEATSMQLKMIPLINSMFAEVNPIPVKAALNMMGKIEKEYRMPLCDPSNKTLYLIKEELTKYGIKLP